MIHHATRDDIPAVLVMLRKHHAEHDFKWPFDAVPLSISLAHAIATPDNLVLVDDGALLWARYFDCDLGSGRHAAERAFWSEHGQGPSLIEHYEQWARENGCKDTTLSCMRKPGAFARLYGRSGYRPTETTFVKAL